MPDAGFYGFGAGEVDAERLADCVTVREVEVAEGHATDEELFFVYVAAEAAFFFAARKGDAEGFDDGRFEGGDVYFAFDAAAEWTGVPPSPADWMHQLGNDERTLDGDKMRIAVEKLLETLD